MNGEQFRQHVKEKLMEVPIFLICVKNVQLSKNWLGYRGNLAFSPL
jgi:hypothetical protein